MYLDCFVIVVCSSTRLSETKELKIDRLAGQTAVQLSDLLHDTVTALQGKPHIANFTCQQTKNLSKVTPFVRPSFRT